MVLGTCPAHGSGGRAVVKRRIAAVSGFSRTMIVTLCVLLTSCSGSSSSSSSSAQTAKAGEMTVTILSDPTPLKAGDNNLMVTVKQPDGTPLTDGTVTAVFSMPAMPSMNMPAMRSDAPLAHQGAGVYRGTGQLSMSGTWNLSVSVTRDGRNLGSAKFNVVAK